MGNNFNRRDFLKFMGLASAGSFVGTSLPIYKSFAASGAAPLRLLILPKYFGWMTRETSLSELATLNPSAPQGFTLPDYFSPLDKHKSKMIVIENLRGTYWGNAHDHSYANILTNACVQYEMTSKQLMYNEPMGPSIDWLIGNRLNKDVLRADFGIGRGAPICFDDKFLRQPMDSSVEQMYDSVIKPILAFQNGASESDLMLRSVNQVLFETLGKSTQRVEKLLQGTGNEERKISNFRQSLELSNPNSKVVSSILAPITDPGRTAEGTSLEHALKITKAAFMADTKRVGVVSFGGNVSGSNLVWRDKSGMAQTGMDKINQEWRDAGNTSKDNDFHHLVSHYSWGQALSGNPRLCMNGAIKYFIQIIANFVDDLSTTIDVDGRPMIENTCIVLTSEITDGNHDTSRMPMILIGGNNAGRLKLGRVLKGPIVDSNKIILNTLTRDGKLIRSGFRGVSVGLRTQGDVFVSLARAMGVNINTFGFEPHNSEPFNLTG